jgi:Kdo2-lipid IVA lauroyltransferase/acyltransferase
MSTWPVALRKQLSRVSLTWITRIIRFFAVFVPYRLGVRSGAALGFLAYYLLPRERKRTLTHLSMAFSNERPERVRQLARRCFIHLGKSLLETMLMTPHRLSEVVKIVGRENLRNALNQGKGVIYVTGHIGNWELMAHTVASLSTLSVVAAPIEPEQVNEIILRLRAGMGVRTILRGRPGASRELIRVLKENRILGILIDQDTDVESAFMDFMGRPAWTPTGAASMAIKFGVPVVFGYIYRGEDDRHTITIEGPLELTRTGDIEKDIPANTAMLTKKIEDCIRKQPEQWVWMHRRWRRQP